MTMNTLRPNAGLADYQAILRDAVPLIDLRAAVEFHQGTMPAAINLPLMNDEERAAVGTCYKKQGRQAAVELGHKLVSGVQREQRINAWLAACQRYPQGYLYCARGGMRSHIVQRWLHEAGMDYPLIAGGYKALRRTAIDSITQLVQRPMVLVGGCTGNGKTEMVQSLPNGIDLEGLALHRGSSFGSRVQPQPAQANFENQLAACLLQTDARQPVSGWLLEDEGRAIGALHLPESLRERMACSPIVVIDDPFEIRLQRLRQHYFVDSLLEFQAHYDEADGWQHYADWLRRSLTAIRRRLGLVRYTECFRHLETALHHQQRTGESEAHFDWLIPLLEHYYDPMYRYQLEKKAQQIQFRGSWQQVRHWLQQTMTPSCFPSTNTVIPSCQHSKKVS